MIPVPNPVATRRFAPPRGWTPETHGDCGTLEIADVAGAGGLNFMESLWRPDADELAALAAGASVVLGIEGGSHPVVYVGVSAPPRADPVDEAGTSAKADAPAPNPAALPGAAGVAAGSRIDSGTPTGTGD